MTDKLEQALDNSIKTSGKERLVKAIVTKTYERGDELEVNGKQVRVVEILEPGRLHCKNLHPPFDSFIVLGSEIGLEKGSE